MLVDLEDHAVGVGWFHSWFWRRYGDERRLKVTGGWRSRHIEACGGGARQGSEVWRRATAGWGGGGLHRIILHVLLRLRQVSSWLWRLLRPRRDHLERELVARAGCKKEKRWKWRCTSRDDATRTHTESFLSRRQALTAFTKGAGLTRQEAMLLASPA